MLSIFVIFKFFCGIKMCKHRIRMYPYIAAVKFITEYALLLSYI